jgi:hypothetical protein
MVMLEWKKKRSEAAKKAINRVSIRNPFLLRICLTLSAILTLRISKVLREQDSLAECRDLTRMKRQAQQFWQWAFPAVVARNQ